MYSIPTHIFRCINSFTIIFIHYFASVFRNTFFLYYLIILLQLIIAFLMLLHKITWTRYFICDLLWANYRPYLLLHENKIIYFFSIGDNSPLHLFKTIARKMKTMQSISNLTIFKPMQQSTTHDQCRCSNSY